MKLYIARHGQSKKEVNSKGYFQILGGSTSYNKSLTKKGISQAEELGKLFKDKKIDAVYSSKLLRAKQTAKIALLDYEITYDARLNEKNFGKFSGMFSDHVILVNEDHVDLPLIKSLLGELKGRDYLKSLLYDTNDDNITTVITINSIFPGVEKVEEIIERIKSFESDVRKSNCENVVVICHSGVIRCWMKNVLDEPEKYSAGTVKKIKSLPSKGVYRDVENCSLYEFVLV